MSDSSLSAHQRIVLAGEGARPTRGSPAFRNGEYCYFHFRWRMTHVDVSQSAHHVTSMFDLPVLEEANSIQRLRTGREHVSEISDRGTWSTT